MKVFSDVTFRIHNEVNKREGLVVHINRLLKKKIGRNSVEKCIVT